MSLRTKQYAIRIPGNLQRKKIKVLGQYKPNKLTHKLNVTWPSGHDSLTVSSLITMIIKCMQLKFQYFR